MALPKLFQRILWHNNTTPAINEDNLNAMSQAIDEIDDRVIALGDDVIVIVPQIQAYLEQAEDLVEAMELLSQNPPYIGQNGNWYVWDTATSEFVDSGVDASITVDIADITMIAEGSTPYVTNSGTSTDPVFHLFIPRSPQGEAGVGISDIEKTGTSGLVDTYTITLTDGSTYTFTVTNGQNGSGTGDMLQSDYDSDSTVKNAGGIKAWVQSLGYITGLAWSALTNKPFSTVGNGLTVSSDTLTANIQNVVLQDVGTASSTQVKESDLIVESSAGIIGYAVTGSRYMEQTIVTSTSQDVTATFTNSAITTGSAIKVWADKWGIVPSNVVTTSGQCVVTIPKQDTAFSLGIRIYLM